MCIRDRGNTVDLNLLPRTHVTGGVHRQLLAYADRRIRAGICLLYTSDAADERSSVDLGGRRIIKKKKNNKHLAVVEITYV